MRDAGQEREDQHVGFIFDEGVLRLFGSLQDVLKFLEIFGSL